MTSSPVYTEEELNCFKLLYIVQTVTTEGLRIVFQKEWDRSTGYRWIGGQSDRDMLYNWMLNGEQNPKELEKIRQARIEDWDCTKLCQVILFLEPEYNLACSVWRLKKIRNEVSHNPRGRISAQEFQTKATFIANIFEGIGLSVIARKIRFIEQQKRFDKEEPNKLRATFTDKSFCGLPLPPSHAYTFRGQEVEDIISRLNKMRTSNGHSFVSAAFYIYGNAGCGKSQVARQVGETLYNRGNDSVKVVATLNAENSTRMVDSLGKLASDLGCQEESVNSALQLSNEEKSLRILSNSVRSRLKTLPWLIIVENITKNSSFKNYWPQPGDQTWGRGQVLVTTQDARTVPCKSKYIDNILLSKGMTEKDAKYLLSSVSNLETEGSSEVAKALDYQPLALACAATYVKEASVSWVDYIGKLKEGKQESTEELYLNASAGSYAKSMTSAVVLFSRYMWDDDPVLRKAFCFLAFCAPEQPVPLELIIQYVMRNNPTLDEGVVKGKLKACTHLLLDEIREGSVDKIVTRHQVVQHSFVKLVEETFNMNTSEHSAAYTLLPDILITFQVYYESLHKSWDVCAVVKKRLYFHHLRKIAEIVARKTDFLEIERNVKLEDCLERLGYFCQAYSKHTTAQTFYKLALHFREGSYGREHLKVAILRNKLGNTHLKLSNFNDAETCCRESLQMLRLEKKVEVSVAECLTNLGMINEKKGKLKKSKDFFVKALGILDEHPPSDLEVKALPLNALGTTCFRLGDYKASFDNVHEALYLRRKENNPKISQSLCNLGFIASEILTKSQEEAKKYLEEAERYLEEAFTILASNYDSDNILFGYVFCNKGIVSRKMGKLKEAKVYSLEACDNFRIYGSDPIELAEATDYLGMVHYKLEALEEAKKCHEEAIQTWKERNGEQTHPILGRFEQNLGLVLEATGDLTSAMEHYQISLKVMETCGEYHPKVAEALDRITSIHREKGNTSEAEVTSNRARQIWKKVKNESDENACNMQKRSLGEHQSAKSLGELDSKYPKCSSTPPVVFKEKN